MELGVGRLQCAQCPAVGDQSRDATNHAQCLGQVGWRFIFSCILLDSLGASRSNGQHGRKRQLHNNDYRVRIYTDAYAFAGRIAGECTVFLHASYTRRLRVVNPDNLSHRVLVDGQLLAHNKCE